MPEHRRRVRNPVARSPLLRKGGPHQRSRSSERREQRLELEAALDSWWDEEDIESQDPGPGLESPAPFSQPRLSL